MLSMQRVCLLFVLAGCVLVSLLGGNSFAQDIPVLKEEQKSVILFDARIDKFVENARKYEGSEALENLPMEGPFQGIKITELKRVFGAASLPSDLGKIMALMGGPPEKLPLDFFIRIQFLCLNLGLRLPCAIVSMRPRLRWERWTTVFRKNETSSPINSWRPTRLRLTSQSDL